MTEDKRVLIIAYHYPPLAGAGMLKILRTTRYLAQNGWDPFVLTVKNPEAYHRADNPIPEGVRVFRAWRIPGGNLLARILRRLHLDERLLLIPDQHIFWIPGVFCYGIYLILKHKIDLIYVTAPPYSALIGGALLKRITGRPLVVDIRDPWSFNAARKGYPTPIHRWLDLAYERRVLRNADFITCIYKITQEGYERLYPWLVNKTAVFYDTVDEKDLPVAAEPFSVFTLTYLGTFYPPFHSLRATLQGIRLLLDDGRINAEKFRFHYVGPPDVTFERFVTEYGLDSVVLRGGYLPLKEAQLAAARSQQLLLLLEFPTINTKLFDYLATGNDILAVVPECLELNELLHRYGDYYTIVTDFDPVKIAESVIKCYNRFYQGVSKGTECKAELFRRELNIETETTQLTTVFNRVRQFHNSQE